MLDLADNQRCVICDYFGVCVRVSVMKLTRARIATKKLLYLPNFSIVEVTLVHGSVAATGEVLAE